MGNDSPFSMFSQGASNFGRGVNALTGMFGRGANQVRRGVNDGASMFNVDPAHRESDTTGYQARTARNHYGAAYYDNKTIQQDTQRYGYEVENHGAANWAAQQHYNLDHGARGGGWNGGGDLNGGFTGQQGGGWNGQQQGGGQYYPQSYETQGGNGFDERNVRRADGRMTAPGGDSYAARGGAQDINYEVTGREASESNARALAQFDVANTMKPSLFGFGSNAYADGHTGVVSADTVNILEKQVHDLSPERRSKIAKSLDVLGEELNLPPMHEATDHAMAARLSALIATGQPGDISRTENSLKNNPDLFFAKLTGNMEPLTDSISQKHNQERDALNAPVMQAAYGTQGKDTPATETTAPATHAASANPANDGVLSRADGASSEQVHNVGINELQAMLKTAGLGNELGHTGRNHDGVDGNFGKNTQEAVKAAAAAMERLGVYSGNADKTGVADQAFIDALQSNAPKTAMKNEVTKGRA